MVDVVIGLVVVESFQWLKQQSVGAGAAAVARDLQVECRVGRWSNDLAEAGSRLAQDFAPVRNPPLLVEDFEDGRQRLRMVGDLDGDQIPRRGRTGKAEEVQVAAAATDP